MTILFVTVLKFIKCATQIVLKIVTPPKNEIELFRQFNAINKQSVLPKHELTASFNYFGNQHKHKIIPKIGKTLLKQKILIP